MAAFPHDYALESLRDGDFLPLEEERRLLYVAVTRAKDALYLSVPQNWRGKKAKPSRLLDYNSILKRCLDRKSCHKLTAFFYYFLLIILEIVLKSSCFPSFTIDSTILFSVSLETGLLAICDTR